jgi:hypothetical protein
MPKRLSSLIWTVGAAVIVLSICKAPAHDLGQWDGVDPAHRQWFNGLKQPEYPHLSCCGLADAYWADSYEVYGNQYVAIILTNATTNRSAVVTSKTENVL